MGNNKNDKIKIIKNENDNDCDNEFINQQNYNEYNCIENDESQYCESKDEEEAIGRVLSGDFLDSVGGEVFVFDNIPEKEVKNLEKDINRIKKRKALEADQGFLFEPKCHCCNLAVDDPEIHHVWLQNRQKVGPVQRYIIEKYGKKIKYESIDKHMKEHFIPIYDEVSYQRRENLLNIKRWIKEREDTIYPNRLQAFEEMLIQKIENVFIRSQNQPIELEMMALKSLTSAGAVLVKIQEHKLAILGQNKSPEEMQKTMTEFVKGLLYKVLEKAPDEKTKKEWAAMFQKILANGNL